MLPSLPARLVLLLLTLCSPWHRSASAQVVSYHGASSATHQSQFNTLSAAGYRLTSLSVAGGLSAPIYTAVWEQVSGPGWVASHDMSSAQYTAQRTTWINQGYRAKLITAAGSGSNTVFAAVFVNDGASVVDFTNEWPTNIDNKMAFNRNGGRIPVSIDMYGSGQVTFYCGVFEPNPTNIVWGYDLDATSTSFSATRSAHEDGGERLACIGMSDAQEYVSVWYDQRVGTEHIATNQSSTGWQTAFTNYTAAGLSPRVIASGGSGAALRFAGSFAQYRTPQPRQLTITGTYRSQFAAFDTYLTNLVQNHGRRAGGIAIAKDGKLVYARVVNWTEAGLPIVQPTGAFRIASCTKPLIAIACHEADEQNLLAMTTSPGVTLGLSYADPQFANVDLRHLLEYTSGVVRNYDAWTVATWLNPSSPVLPVTLVQGSQWMAQQNLRFAPGTYGAYSNCAFLLAAEILRVRTGQSYMSFLQSDVLGPLGITRMHVAPSEFANLGANDVRHQLSVLQLLPSELHTDRRRSSAQFAEDLSFIGPAGGVASSVVDYVRFLSGIFDLQGQDAIVLGAATRASVLARHSYTDFEAPAETSDVCLAGMAWKQRPNGMFVYSKGGWLPTNASTDVCWREDGISWAVFLNNPDASANGDTINDMIDNVTSWPNVDEFPAYGLPAFPQRAAIDSIAPASSINVTSSYLLVAGKRLDTVTQVNFGSRTITSTSPTDWQDGYFVVTSPTVMRLYPPQGLIPTTYAVSLTNAVGTSATEDVGIVLGSTFRLGAPTVVAANQPWSVYVARGTASGLTLSNGFGILCLSFSNQPSSAPGFVNLGLGNQFTDFVTSGAFQFSLLSSVHRFDLPPLPSGTVYLEAVGFDLGAPSLFPLLTTNTTATARL